MKLKCKQSFWLNGYWLQHICEEALKDDWRILYSSLKFFLSARWLWARSLIYINVIQCGNDIAGEFDSLDINITVWALIRVKKKWWYDTYARWEQVVQTNSSNSMRWHHLKIRDSEKIIRWWKGRKLSVVSVHKRKLIVQQCVSWNEQIASYMAT